MKVLTPENKRAFCEYCGCGRTVVLALLSEPDQRGAYPYIVTCLACGRKTVPHENKKNAEEAWSRGYSAILPEKRELYDRIIMGIDPSVRSTGLGVIGFSGRKIKYIDCLTVQLNEKLRFAQCLHEIFKAVSAFAKKHAVTEAAIEAPPYVKSVSVLRKLGGVESICILPMEMMKIPITEFAPLEIKKSATGYGKSDKSAVQHYVRGIFGLDFLPQNDAADAIACALALANKSTELIPAQIKPV